jgi:hypothetical protein
VIESFIKGNSQAIPAMPIGVTPLIRERRESLQQPSIVRLSSRAAQDSAPFSAAATKYWICRNENAIRQRLTAREAAVDLSTNISSRLGAA